MVNLIFNPKESNIIIKSRSSTKKNKVGPVVVNAPTSLNPLKNLNEDLIDNNLINNTSINTSINSNLSELYKPTKLKDLVGLDHTLYYLNNWYKKSLSDLSNPFLIIIGEVGCGKTSLVKLYSSTNKIKLFDINGSNEKIDIDSELDNIINYSNDSQRSNEYNQYKLILIDDYKNSQLDVITISGINNLYKSRITNKRIPPIVIISADCRGSKLSELKSIHDIHYINDISLELIKNWIQYIIKDYNSKNEIKITLNTEQLMGILSKTRSDKHYLLNTLEFLKGSSNNLSFFKDSDIDNFTFIQQLFNNIEPLDINYIYKSYSTDGYALANLIHENYLDYNSSIERIAESADHISNGEYILNRLYTPGVYFSEEFHCLESLVFPGYYSRCDNVVKTPLRTPYINNRHNIYLNNKKLLDKLKLNMTDVQHFKNFLNHSLVKKKVLSTQENDYLKGILSFFKNDINTLEILYKYFNNYFGNDSKNNVFTKKFKEKLDSIIKDGIKISS